MSPRRTALLTLSLLLLSTRGITVADGSLHLDTAVGLVERGEAALSVDPGDLWVEDRPIAGALVYFEGDRVRTALPPGLALLAALPVGVGAAAAKVSEAPPIASLIQPLFIDEGRSLGDLLRPLNRDPRAVGITLLGPVAGTLAVLFLLLSVRALDVSVGAQRAAVLALLCSPLAVFSGTTWTQPVTAAALSFATYQLVLRGRDAGRPMLGLGMALAVATVVRLDHAPFVLAFLLGLLLITPDRGRRVRVAAELLGPFAVVVGFLLLWDLPEAPEGAWSLARLPLGLSGLLISPLTGLLFYAPFALLALFGVGALREHRALWPLLVIPLSQLLLYGGWQDWDATFAYGPRFLVPSLPLFALLLGLAWDRTPKLRPLIALTLGLGLVVALPGVLLNHARIPDQHDFMQPAFFDAWAVLIADRSDAIGRSVDCASTYVPFLGLAASGVASLGLVGELRGPGTP